MTTMASRAILLALVLLLAACPSREGVTPMLPVAGGNMPSLPPLPAQDAHIEAAALEAAAIAASGSGADALLIARNGHLLLERYWHGTRGATHVDAGAWQGLIDDLLVGALVNDHEPIDTETPQSRAAIVAAAGMPYEAYLARRLWRPIGAADAVLVPDLRAAQADWLRVGEILANDGVYQGEEIVRPGWVVRVLERRAAAHAATTAVSLRGLYRLPGADGAVLWVAPALRLVILRTGAAAADDRGDADAAIADYVLRGVTDRPHVPGEPTGMPAPATLVPAH
ncbi:MAG: hypothetical protein KIT37_14600 [Steroidobacteraceae bacterium]|nr:hypothetical protein [Steroidobacteraceae bacterium]